MEPYFSLFPVPKSFNQPKITLRTINFGLTFNLSKFPDLEYFIELGYETGFISGKVIECHRENFFLFSRRRNETYYRNRTMLAGM